MKILYFNIFSLFPLPEIWLELFFIAIILKIWHKNNFHWENFNALHGRTHKICFLGFLFCFGSAHNVFQDIFQAKNLLFFIFFILGWPRMDYFSETFFKLETSNFTWRPQQQLELAITCLVFFLRYFFNRETWDLSWKHNNSWSRPLPA